MRFVDRKFSQGDKGMRRNSWTV